MVQSATSWSVAFSASITRLCDPCYNGNRISDTIVTPPTKLHPSCLPWDSQWTSELFFSGTPRCSLTLASGIQSTQPLEELSTGSGWQKDSTAFQLTSAGFYRWLASTAPRYSALPRNIVSDHRYLSNIMSKCPWIKNYCTGTIGVHSDMLLWNYLCNILFPILHDFLKTVMTRKYK